MAIEWGAWEGSGNEMRVGIDVSWEPITHGETAATATIEIYTQNNFTWDDDQTLNYGGSISGSTSFHNGQGDGVITKRATKTYTYTYGSNSYGTSPADRTFTATLSGAFNGITPSKSVTKAVPARPYAAPAAPTNAAVSRISDTSTKITWTNKDTAGEPWDGVWLDRSINGGSWSRISSSISGSATSYTHSTADNTKYRFRVAADNSVGTSGWDETGDIYTTPEAPSGTPTNAAGTGSQRVVGWSNSGIGYSEYNTEVWVSRDGGATFSLLATAVSGATSYTDTAANASQKTGYKVRHKTTAGSQGTLYSAFTPDSTFTPGTTTQPPAATGLQPANLTVDPTLPMRLSWTFQPGQVGDAQTQFTVRHRIAGATNWTEATVATANQFYDVAANTYAEQQIIEWTVITYGADPTPSPEAVPVSFTTAVAAIAPDPVKLPVLMDLFTGQLEASSTAYELRNYVARIQSQLVGGGIRAVDASYNVSWSQRFIAISLGRSGSTFPKGHHDIVNPYGWNVTNKVLTSNVATLTLTVTNANKFRVGDKITVTGVGAPFDSAADTPWTVRGVTTNTVSFDVVAANVASTAATGAAYATIKGHGGASDVVPASIKVPLASWSGLYYELPFGWGAGTTSRKNGVVKVTSISLTSNVVTVNTVAPHYFAVGDRVMISGCGAPYDSATERVITGVSTNGTAASFTFALTNANVASSNPANGLATPSGKDTFFSNFHTVSYSSDFVVPDNWILLALRNGDASTVEWGSGDSVDPGYDSDSPVLKQVILNSTTDVTATAGNKPALRVGSITGGHIRMDGNELQAMASDSAVGGFMINAGGGNVTLGHSAYTIQLNGTVEMPHIPTTTNSANCNLNQTSSNRPRAVTSLSRFKLEQEAITREVARGLLRLTPKTWYDRTDVEERGGTDGLRRIPGFIAEDVEAEAPTWALYDENGDLNGVSYDRVAAGLLVIVQEQAEQIAALTARLDAIEGV